MPQRYDVAIVGAGVVGCSVAFHLAQLGTTGVVVLEREALPGSGSTSKANGGIRAQFTTEPNVAMSLASMRILDDLAADIGEPPLYRKAGYLFVTGSASRLREMEEAVAFQRELGVDVVLLDEPQVRERAPFVSGPIVGGTFGGRDGFIDPGGLTSYFLRRATRAGVTLRCDAEAIGLAESPGGWTVCTSAGDLRASVVVIAAGPYSGRVAALAGIDLPVEPVRRHIVVSGPCPDLPPVIPMTIDADTGVLVRREGDRAAIAWSNADEPAGFNLAFDPDFPQRFAEPLETRFPVVSAAGIDFRRSWAGLYEVTPDHHAVIGPVPGRPGLIVATGFSGHGVMHAPAAGLAVAETIVRGRTGTVDVSALSIERFTRGELIHERLVL